MLTSSSATRSASPGRYRSQKAVIETKYMLTRQGPLGSSSQSSVAASFFAKAHTKLAVPRSRSRESSSEERDLFPTCFSTLVHRSPPPIPSFLLKRLESNPEEEETNGRIKILLRVAPGPQHENFFILDKRKRQITLYDPSSSFLRNQNNPSSGAPKMFAFDGVFAATDPQEEVSSLALSDAIHSVMNGRDASVFCFGHANLGKSRTMIGSDECSKDLGIIPTAIAWLYRAVKERKAKSGARFSLRVSALEILSGPESIKDLLASYESVNDGASPGIYLTHQTSHLANISELRAASPEKAAFYFDAALASRTQGERSHFLFTIYLYQYTMDNSNYTGGRSRLHLIDFGSCDRTRSNPQGGITLSGLGNAILGIFNGQKHLPHRESKVTQVLKECLGSHLSNATVIAHVSSEPSHYSETLHTVSVSSRLHRVRRRRIKTNSRVKSRSRLHQGSSSELTTSGTSTNVSSSDFSCDTVVYRGSDSSGTDNEHPPNILYGVRSLRHHHSAPNSLKGSYDDIPRPRRRVSGSKILTNGAISPRHNSSSPSPSSNRTVRSSHSSLLLPSIPEGGKMPLNGRVPVRRQAPPSSASNEEISKNSRSKYGYMDDHKANMINSWVQRQSAPIQFQALTQFKTCEDEEITRASNEVQANFSSRKETNRLPSTERQTPRPLTQATIPEESVHSEILDETEDDDDLPPLPPPPPMEPMTVLGTEQHPLRILSEENLTVVSSFGGSLNDLQNLPDEEELEEAKLLEEYNKVMETLLDTKDRNELMEFTDMKDIDSFYGNKSERPNGNSILHLPRAKSASESLNNNINANIREHSGMSPQKQFKLLGESLRHPDGSSNPELSQKELSDLYNNNNTIDQSEGLMNDSVEEINGNTVLSNDKELKNSFSKKEPSRFSFRIFRFFKSKNKDDSSRSKSCERARFLDNNKVLGLISKKSSSSRSASPSVAAKTSSPDTESVAPSVMSMDTEWEYQQQQQQHQTQSCNFPNYPPPSSYACNVVKYGVTGDRKSSGYDSIGGESSSLDSNEDGLPPVSQAPPMGGHPDSSDSISSSVYKYPSPLLMEYDERDILRMEARLQKI